MRLRDRETPHPDEARDLAALEAALAGADNELSALVGGVRETRPRLRPEAAARLDALVEEGLAHEPRRRLAGARAATRQATARGERLAALLTPRNLGLAGGTLAAAGIAVVIAVGGSGGGSTSGLGSSGAGDSVQAIPSSSGGSAAKSAAPAAAAGGGATESVAPRQGTLAAPDESGSSGDALSVGRAREVERTTELALTAPADRVQRAADGVVAVADRFRAIVERSDISLDDAGRGEATFALRVPTARLQEALGALSRLAHVRSRSETSLDITAQTATTADRLAEARAQRDSLLRRLAASTTDTQAAALRARLRDTRARIAAYETDAKRLAVRAGYARVDVTLTSTGKRHDGTAASKHHDGGAWGPGDAWRDAERILSGAAAVGIVAGVLGVPLLGLLALTLVGARRTRRRRREAALGAA